MGATSTESDGASAVRAQLARVLSLDVDGSGFPRLAEDDPVVAERIAAYPGLRPVCFYSPYEAAAWAIIGHRIRMVQAAAIKARIAQHHGQCFTVAGESLYAFPTPLVLRGLSRVPGLPQTKVERLRVLADATLVGDLDAARDASGRSPRSSANPARHRPLLRGAHPHPRLRTPRRLPPP
jgi:DNA-3-methyladenine glycosylase II